MTTSQAVIITGGGSGIGRAAARTFADRGARVLVVGRSPEPLAETATGYPNITTLVADITGPDAGKIVVDRALLEFGAVDVLINNAAVGVFGALSDLDPEAVRVQFETNVLAPVLLTQCALTALTESGGTIVNVGSAMALGLRAAPQNAVYAATKAALDSLTRSWAVELASRAIRVVGIAPGVVNTGVGVRAGMSAAEYEGFLQHIAVRVPVGRVGRPEEVADWIHRLAQPDAAYLNGTVLTVDGALSVT
ncbi:SDR family oxidoreductase [Micromonospora sp. BRA006-A]|uniref:SDR family NAD(P)-dependent oxidoreductase n=1 Tax=Micromonospora sp. BRA006-A TaxID=2962860 RepID=UPI0011036F91|nr:SDR family oxidoreductase [Micromonospora sp. BRA006-A]MDW3848641.1 SDR family oxidoreductase [Micromonospora sp. BRA006-A]